MKMFPSTNLQIDITDTTDSEGEETEKCTCNKYANRRQCVPAIGMKRIIMNVK